MLKKIDGQAIASKIKKNIAQETYQLKGLRPNLAIILLGERADSKLYVALKEKEGKLLGVDTHLYKLDDDTPESEILKIIDFLNKDDLIDGILVQLPLPKNYNTNKIIEAIDPNKDVDGFRLNHPDFIISPVLASVEASLKATKLNFSQKKACVLYNSEIFGQQIKELLEKQGLVIIPSEKLLEADLVVSALGSPAYLKKEMIKPGAVVIDIGITKVGNKVYGDADFNSLKSHLSFITPVPGGIGPMTIAFLFKNVLEIYRRRHAS